MCVIRKWLIGMSLVGDTILFFGAQQNSGRIRTFQRISIHYFVMKCLALFISFAYGIQPLFPFMIKVIFIFPNCNHDAIKLENNRYGNSTPQRVEVLPRRLRIIIKKNQPQRAIISSILRYLGFIFTFVLCRSDFSTHNFPTKLYTQTTTDGIRT